MKHVLPICLISLVGGFVILASSGISLAQTSSPTHDINTLAGSSGVVRQSLRLIALCLKSSLGSRPVACCSGHPAGGSVR